MSDEWTDIVNANEVLRTVVGSGLHGIAIEGTDDHDEMGIFVEPPWSALGIAFKPLEHWVERTQPEGVRSGPGDTDRVRYSLRKYVRLATQGNPTMLLPLYADMADVLLIGWPGFELRAMRDSIVSRQAGMRFLGYMQSQVGRLRGEKKRPTNRPELVEQYGFDTKFASHAVRLGIQGVELLTEGTIHLPMKQEHRDHILDIKVGKVPEADVLDEVEHWTEHLREVIDSNDGPLPPMPQRDVIDRWLVQTHLKWWSERGSVETS